LLTSNKFKYAEESMPESIIFTAPLAKKGQGNEKINDILVLQ